MEQESSPTLTVSDMAEVVTATGLMEFAVVTEAFAVSYSPVVFSLSEELLGRLVELPLIVFPMVASCVVLILAVVLVCAVTSVDCEDLERRSAGDDIVEDVVVTCA